MRVLNFVDRHQWQQRPNSVVWVSGHVWNAVWKQHSRVRSRFAAAAVGQPLVVVRRFALALLRPTHTQHTAHHTTVENEC